MANVIQELPKISRAGAGGKRGSKYPLDEWFDGQARQLVQGTEEQVKAGEADYPAKTTSIVNMLHGQAAQRGLKLKTVKNEEGVAILAYKEESNGHTETETEKPKARKMRDVTIDE